MKKLVVVIVIGLCLSLGFYSNAFCTRGGGGGGFHGGGFHGRHFASTRVFIGGSFGFPFYYPYGYYPYYPYAHPYPAYPSTYAQPPVYSEPAYSAPEQSYWYYCQDSQSYYPYVKSCPGGWMKVVPTPPQPEEEGPTQ